VRWAKNGRILILFLLLASGLCACGGGGGSSANSNNPVSVADPTYRVGLYGDPGTYAARCANPRSGVDPISHQAYPDQAGSVLWENSWIRAWEHAYYLWYAQLPDLAPASYSTALAYFDADKSSAVTPSGTPVDKFHFTYPTNVWASLSTSNSTVGTGAHWEIIHSSAPREMVLAYTDPNTPAVLSNLTRGASVLKIDGIDFVNATDQSSVNAINAALNPTAVGETHVFTVVDSAGAASHDVSLSAAAVVSQPVLNVKTFYVGTQTVGYFQFNDHLAAAEGVLKSTIAQLQTAHVSDVIVDMRYNGGGYLAIASELAYMIAGPMQTTGKIFETTLFNDQYPTTDPISGQTIVPTPFYATTQGFSLDAGQTLPSLNLARVFVIIGADTCSASESVINSLRGINVAVIAIGSQSCGKPYGFYPQDNCGTTYFSIEFKGVNNQGFGDYTDGFVPENASALNGGVPIPGCAVADDFSHALGDPAEARLATALNYVAEGPLACPQPTGLTVAPMLLNQERPAMVRPVWLTNRILKRPVDPLR